MIVVRCIVNTVAKEERHKSFDDEMKEYSKKLDYLDVDTTSPSGADTGFDQGVGGKYGREDTRPTYPVPTSKTDLYYVRQIEKVDTSISSTRDAYLSTNAFVLETLESCVENWIDKWNTNGFAMQCNVCCEFIPNSEMGSSFTCNGLVLRQLI